MRTLALAVVTVLAVGCGRSGFGDGFGTDNEGIQNNNVGPNGCVAPKSQGFTDPRDALDHGTTGQDCSFTGGAGNGTQLDFCMGHYLFIENVSFVDSSFCTSGPNGSRPDAQLLANGCVESCFNSGGAETSCVPDPILAPNRQMPNPWQMTDCQALLSGCPQIGDPCVGSTVCSGFWHPDQLSSAVTMEGENAVFVCDGGSLKVVVAF